MSGFIPYGHPPESPQIKACVLLCANDACTQAPLIADENNRRTPTKCAACQGELVRATLDDNDTPTAQCRRGSALYTFYCPVMTEMEPRNVVRGCSRVNQADANAPTCKSHRRRMTLLFKPH